MHSRIAKLLLVRDNEKHHVMYFFLLYAILGCGIAFGRNSTDVLFFKRFGVEYLPLMYVAFSVALALISIFYAAFADRISPEKLSIAIFGTLICLLVANWAWIGFGDSSAAYPAYFLLYETASEVLIVHSAHYLSQNYTSLQAKRLFPLIMAGTQVGIIIGSIILAFSGGHIRIQEILLAWSALLAINVFMIYSWHSRHGTSAYFRPIHKSSNQLKQAASQIRYGFTLIKTSRMLRAASFALFFMVITFYILCYSVNRIYTNTFSTEAELSRFFGILTATTNGIALFLQIFITNRVIHRFGVKKVNMFFPVTSILSYIALLSSYSLVPAILGSINKDAIMPAFRNPVRTIFFNTLPENVQGRARATAVVIVLPLALFICGLMLILLQKTGTHQYFLTLGVITGALYLYFNHSMNKAYVKEILTTLRSKVLMPQAAPEDAGTKSPADDQSSAERLGFRKNSAAAKLFNLLMDTYPQKGHELVALHADQFEKNIVDQLIHTLRPLNPPGFSDILWTLYKKEKDQRLQASILTTLFDQGDPRVTGEIPQLLQSGNPRLEVAAIIGALHCHDWILQGDALSKWQELVDSDDIGRQLASLYLLEYLHLAPYADTTLLPSYKSLVCNILRMGDARQISVVLTSLQGWPESQFPEIAPFLTNIFERSNAITRVLCVKCSLLTYQSDQSLLQKAIEDSNPIVRKEAARVHFEVSGEDAKDLLILWLSTESNGSPLAQKAYLELLHEVSAGDERFEQIALNKAKLAHHFYFGHQILSNYTGTRSAAFALVQHILQERIKQYIELSIYAIQGIEKDDDTRLLSMCINSRDSRHIANACEVLRNLRHVKVGQILTDLVDKKPMKFNALHEPRFGESSESVLLWCRSLPDAWLSQCARAALETAA